MKFFSVGLMTPNLSYLVIQRKNPPNHTSMAVKNLAFGDNIYIRTVSSHLLLSTFLIQFKLVYGKLHVVLPSIVHFISAPAQSVLPNPSASYNIFDYVQYFLNAFKYF